MTVRDRETLAELGRAGRYASHVPSAGAVIALVIPKPDGEHARSVLWDLGRAAQNIMLAAWAMGIGSCPITVHDYGLVARTLGLPADRQCEYLITLGWPALRQPNPELIALILPLHAGLLAGLATPVRASVSNRA